MIINRDRSKWFGASDTSKLFGNFNTISFKMFWLEKLGVIKNDFSNSYMKTGNLFEIPIIEKIRDITGEKIKLGKRPYYIRKLRLRANVDGYTKDKVIEIKTTKKMFKKVPLNYWRQCQTLMFALKKHKCELWAYELTDFDYDAPYYPIIDEKRLKKFEIEYDESFIQNEYLPRLRYLSKCLKRGLFPRLENLTANLAEYGMTKK